MPLLIFEFFVALFENQNVVSKSVFFLYISGEINFKM